MSLSANTRSMPIGPVAAGGLARSARIAEANKKRSFSELRVLVLQTQRDTAALQAAGSRVNSTADQLYSDLERTQDSISQAIEAMESLRAHDRNDPLLPPFRQYVEALTKKREILARVTNQRVQMEAKQAQNTTNFINKQASAPSADYSIRVDTLPKISKPPTKRIIVPVVSPDVAVSPKARKPTIKKAKPKVAAPVSNVVKVIKPTMKPQPPPIAGVSLMITQKQRAQLRDMGYDNTAIKNMTPAQAHEILNNAVSPLLDESGTFEIQTPKAAPVQPKVVIAPAIPAAPPPAQPAPNPAPDTSPIKPAKPKPAKPVDPAKARRAAAAARIKAANAARGKAKAEQEAIKKYQTAQKAAAKRATAANQRNDTPKPLPKTATTIKEQYGDPTEDQPEDDEDPNEYDDMRDWQTYKARTLKGKVGNIALNQLAGLFLNKAQNKNGDLTNAMRRVDKYRRDQGPQGSFMHRLGYHLQTAAIKAGSNLLGDNTLGDALRMLDYKRQAGIRITPPKEAAVKAAAPTTPVSASINTPASPVAQTEAIPMPAPTATPEQESYTNGANANPVAPAAAAETIVNAANATINTPKVTEPNVTASAPVFEEPRAAPFAPIEKAEPPTRTAFANPTPQSSPIQVEPLPSTSPPQNNVSAAPATVSETTLNAASAIINTPKVAEANKAAAAIPMPAPAIPMPAPEPVAPVIKAKAATPHIQSVEPPEPVPFISSISQSPIQVTPAPVSSANATPVAPKVNNTSAHVEPVSTEQGRRAYSTSESEAREVADLDNEDSKADKWAMAFWPDFARGLFDRLDKLNTEEGEGGGGGHGGGHGGLIDDIIGAVGGTMSIGGAGYKAYKYVKNKISGKPNPTETVPIKPASNVDASKPVVDPETPKATPADASVETPTTPATPTVDAPTVAADGTKAAAVAPDAATVAGTANKANQSNAATSLGANAAPTIEEGAAATLAEGVAANAAHVATPTIEVAKPGILGKIGSGIKTVAKTAGSGLMEGTKVGRALSAAANSGVGKFGLKAVGVLGEATAPIIGALTARDSLGYVKGSSTIGKRVAGGAIGLAGGLVNSAFDVAHYLKGVKGRHNEGNFGRAVLTSLDKTLEPTNFSKADSIATNIIQGKMVQPSDLTGDMHFEDMINRTLLNIGDGMVDDVNSTGNVSAKNSKYLPNELSWATRPEAVEFFKQPGTMKAFANAEQDVVQNSTDVLSDYYQSVQDGTPLSSIQRALPDSVTDIKSAYDKWAAAHNKSVSASAAPPPNPMSPDSKVHVAGPGLQIPNALREMSANKSNYPDTGKGVSGTNAPLLPSEMPLSQQGRQVNPAMPNMPSYPGNTSATPSPVVSNNSTGLLPVSGGNYSTPTASPDGVTSSGITNALMQGAGMGESASNTSASNGPGSTTGKAMGTDASIPVEGRALLDTISGPESAGKYNVMYGGKTFDLQEGSQHPNVAVPITRGSNAGQTSSAAGRYQFIHGTWEEAQNALGLKDFTPANQDKAAWWLAQRNYKQRNPGHELSVDLKSKDPAVRANIAHSLSSTWTSLPGSQTGETGTTMNKFNATLDKQTAAYQASDAAKTATATPTDSSTPVANTQTVSTSAAVPAPQTKDASTATTPVTPTSTIPQVSPVANASMPSEQMASATATADTPPPITMSGAAPSSPNAGSTLMAYDPFANAPPPPAPVPDAVPAPVKTANNTPPSMVGTSPPNLGDIPMAIDTDNLLFINLADFTT